LLALRGPGAGGASALTRPPGHKIAGEKFHARFFLAGSVEAPNLGGRRAKTMQLNREGLELAL